MKSILLASLIALVSSYDLYKQCDDRWKSDMVGKSERTMCQIGGGVASIAMILEDCDENLYGIDVNPGSLNRWLKENNGYTTGGEINWKATDVLSNGVLYVTTTNDKDAIKGHLNKGNAVITRMATDSTHFMLAYGYSGA